MINITEEQKLLLRVNHVPFSEDIDELLLALDAKITEVGFTKDQQNLNARGLKLQRLYDQLFNQN